MRTVLKPLNIRNPSSTPFWPRLDKYMIFDLSCNIAGLLAVALFALYFIGKIAGLEV